MHATEHIRSLTLDEDTIIRRSAEVEHERRTALNDLLAVNQFRPLCLDHESGPYDVHLGVADNRLRFTIESDNLDSTREVILPLASFRRIIKDYFLMVESYYSAINANNTHKVEALDMGRRGIHNEGSEILQEALKDRITIDFDTARRLFTLICVLHIKQ